MTKRSPDFTPRASWLWPVAALSLLGCPNEELAPIGPCTVSGVFDKITQNANDQVDLLFVVDNSQSMKEEQTNLAEQLPRLVSILASGKITDADGNITREFPPVKSLHLGVVNSDMGINGAPDLGKCNGFGGDGLLQNTVNAAVQGCEGKTFDNTYLDFTAGEDDPTALGADFGCITNVGIEGCGFEQQLEAGWKALAPSSNTSFSRGTRGHGDAENKGFLRTDSVIALIQVSDEEDCSIPDTARDLFTSTQGEMILNVKCIRNPDKQHKADRYINGLKSLRAETPDQVIFAAIVGIPPEAEGLVKNDLTDFDGILALPAMKYDEKDDPTLGRVPVESCNTAAGFAYPPRRFVEVAKGFGKNGIVKSICRDDFSPALTAIIDKIADQLQGACLERTLIADPQTGLAPCGLVEYQKVGATEADCSVAKGRRFLEIRQDEQGRDRVVCALNQLAVKKDNAGCDAAAKDGEVTPAQCLGANPNDPNAAVNPRITDQLVGWYYDDFSADLRKNPQCNAQRIAFTEGAEQAKGTEVRFECLQPVFSVFANPTGVDAVNKPCKDDPNVCKNASDGDYTLFCEDKQRSTCQIRCEEDANCPDGWVCDKDAPVALCLNPTCPS